MKAFYVSRNGFVKQPQWQPHCWVSVVMPDEADMRFMLDDLGVPGDFIQSIADDDERPRVDREGQWRLIILRIPVRAESNDMPYTTVPIGIVLNNEILLTLCFHRSEMLQDFIDHTRCRGIEIDSHADFILRILYSSAYRYLKYLREMTFNVVTDQTQLQKSIQNRDLLQMLSIQRTLVFFNTSIDGNQTLIKRLQTIFADSYDADLLDDVEIELRQADTTVKIYSEILDSTMGSFASIISNNLSVIMKRMTAVSIVLMVPTLIASFYGMNVSVAGGNDPRAFWAIIAGSLLLSFMLYQFLRRIHWF